MFKRLIYVCMNEKESAVSSSSWFKDLKKVVWTLEARIEGVSGLWEEISNHLNFRGICEDSVSPNLCDVEKKKHRRTAFS